MVTLQRTVKLLLFLCFLFLGEFLEGGVVEGGGEHRHHKHFKHHKHKGVGGKHRHHKHKGVSGKLPKPEVGEELHDPKSKTFNVKDFGAKGNGVTEDTQAFLDAWRAACSSPGPKARLHIPKSRYLLGQLKLWGPCNNLQSITVVAEGDLLAVEDLKRYKSDIWVEFAKVTGLVLKGGGTFDGQGASAWPHNKCPKKKFCDILPISLKFIRMTNTQVRNITSLNSKFFHIGVVDCTNFKASGLQIIAPDESPNTDGIHIERCSNVHIVSSVIGTGDDCISIGHNTSDIVISGITCGPGHGISVGSLGKYPKEGDVTGLVVRNSILTGTMNGVRIKTWENSPGSSSASNMTFKDITMNNVSNPIIIDQCYCPLKSCSSAEPSKVKISDITFRNIKGTSSSPEAVTLKCSQGFPCRNVELHNINLEYKGPKKATATSTCLNIKAKYSGIQIPPPCS